MNRPSVQEELTILDSDEAASIIAGHKVEALSEQELKDDNQAEQMHGGHDNVPEARVALLNT